MVEEKGLPLYFYRVISITLNRTHRTHRNVNALNERITAFGEQVRLN